MDHNAEEKVGQLTIQTFVAAKKEDANCRLLAENANAPNS